MGQWGVFPNSLFAPTPLTTGWPRTPDDWSRTPCWSTTDTNIWLNRREHKMFTNKLLERKRDSYCEQPSVAVRLLIAVWFKRRKLNFKLSMWIIPSAKSRGHYRKTKPFPNCNLTKISQIAMRFRTRYNQFALMAIMWLAMAMMTFLWQWGQCC